MADPITWIAAKVGVWVAAQVTAALATTTLSAGTISAIATAANYAAQALVYVGAFALTNALGSSGIPAAEQGKAPVNSTTPWRQIGTGRFRLSGKRSMWEAIKGWNIEIVHLHEGAIDGFEQFYLNDDKVTLDANGWVQKLPDGTYGEQAVRILTRKGAAGETAFQEIIDLCVAAGQPDLYTSAHVGKGIAKVALLCKAVRDKDVLKVYRNGPPLVSVVARMSKVFDWRDPSQSVLDPTTWKWSENAVVNHVHAEWCLSQLPAKVDGTGWIQGDGRAPPPECLENWTFDWLPQLAKLTHAADVCDVDVPLAAGGTEKKYRQGGWWEMNVAPADLRARYLDCYDGRMVEAGDGAFILQAGEYAAPTYVLRDPHLKSAVWNRGAPDKDKVNVLIGTFTSALHGWSAQEGQAWRNEDSIARIGEKTRAVDLVWVPSFTQMRRLLKRMMARAGADRNGDVGLDFDGLNAIEERYVRIERKNGPASMRDVIVEIVGGSIDLAGGTVPLSVVKADPNVDAWNPATEEGQAPQLEERATAIFAPIPVILSATPRQVSVGGAQGLTIQIKITDPVRPGLEYAPRWRVVGAASWKEESPRAAEAVSGGLQVETSFVAAGNLEVAVASYSGGTLSDWSLAFPVTASITADPSIAYADAYYDACAVKPNPTQFARIKALVSAIYAAGVWSKLDALYVMAAHDAPSARINVKTPGVFDLAEVAAPVFTAYRGYQGNGTTSYLTTGFDPSSGTHVFTLNDAHMGVWTQTEGQSTAPGIGSEQCRIVVRNTSDTMAVRANSSGTTSKTGITSALGHSMYVRSSSTAVRQFKNGAFLSPAGSQASTAFIAGQIFRIGGTDNTATDSFSARQFQAAHFGSQLTDAEAAALYAALQTYLTAVGAV